MYLAAESFCGVGRPCPNFQRLIEYVEPVDEEEGAAGDGLPSGGNPRRRTSRISSIQETRSSNAITRWNPQTSRLNISRPTDLHRFRHTHSQANCSQSRRPKLIDIRSAGPLPGVFSAKMTIKLENHAGAPEKNISQQRKMEPKQLQAKPSVKINEMTKNAKSPAGVPGNNIAQQRKWEPKSLQTKPSVSISQNKATPSSTILDAQLDAELSRMLTHYGVSASKLDRRLQQLVGLEDRRKTPRKQ